MQQLATIAGLYIYPIKSCAGVSLDKALVTKHGLASAENPQVLDRKWMIIDQNNVFISQRTVPKMALIKIRIEGDDLVLSAPDAAADLKVPVKAPQNKRECKCKDHMIFGNVYGGDVAQWLSAVLGNSYDLACYDDSFEARKLVNMKKNNQLNLKETDEAVYADYSQLMLLSDASMKDLNTRTPYPVSFWNFRPNIVVGNCQAYSEDDWMFIQCGGSTFRKTRHCTRCLLTTVDPEKGVKDPDSEPLKTLRTYRLNVDLYGQSPLLGINLVTDHETTGHVISIGDQVFDNNNTKQ